MSTDELLGQLTDDRRAHSEAVAQAVATRARYVLVVGHGQILLCSSKDPPDAA